MSRMRKLLEFSLRSLYSPVKTFSAAGGERSYYNPFMFLLSFGLITASLSAVLSSFGVDYSNPSNAGGSAQLFAAWIVQSYVKGDAGLTRLVLFALSVEAGYVILALLSVPIIASIARALIREEAKRQDLPLKALKAVCYGMGPGLFFGWIPNPVYMFGLWATAWQTIGIYVYFGLTKLKAVATALLWVVITGIAFDVATFLWNLVI